MLKWYERVIRVEDDRWRKRIMKWSPEGRLRGGRIEAKWETEIEGVMKKGNVTSDDAINWRIWRVKISNRWTNGKVILRTRKAAIRTNGLFLKRSKLL